MSLECKEVEMFFGRCRCCFEYGYLKNMWTVHTFNDKIEIYGEMLLECYNLPFQLSQMNVQEHICEECISKLRSAHTFRARILDSQTKLTKETVDSITDNHNWPIKNEIEEMDDDDDEDECALQIVCDDDPRSGDDQETLAIGNDTVQMCGQNGNDTDEDCYEEIEYLEEDIIATDPVKPEELSDAAVGDEGVLSERKPMKGTPWKTAKPSYKQYTDEDLEKCLDAVRSGRMDQWEAAAHYNIPKKTVASKMRKEDEEYDEEGTRRSKWPKRLPRNKRNRTYKQYSDEELRMCLEAVRSGAMNITDAAARYNVPKKTVAARVRNDDDNIDLKTNKEYLFHKEIKTLLSYTNGTPYKSKAVRYFCIYCNSHDEFYADPDELRNHTATVHRDERTKMVDRFMRPHWENEILKLDIDNLICVVCSELIPDWNDMLKHLEETHDVNLEQVYTRVIPYILTSDLRCALCKAPFANYLQLDGHMNSHYNNYVCSECGDHFLTQLRLKAHQKIHGDGRYPCEVCKKVFTLDKYRKKHVDMVHNHIMKFKCTYCNVKFQTENIKLNHIHSEHKDKLVPINCELCGHVFHLRQHYAAHMKRAHAEIVKKHGCNYCDKSFAKKCHLKDHVLSRHLRLKNVECAVCKKRYSSKTYLRMHIMKQHRDRIIVVEKT